MPKYVPNSRERCPYCLTVVRFECTTQSLYKDSKQISQISYDDGMVMNTSKPLRIIYALCPECDGVVLTVETGVWEEEEPRGFETGDEFVVFPLQTARPPVPNEVKQESVDIASDYQESALVLNLSPKASSALSRRCLQAVLREKGNANQHNLSDQIDTVMPHLPTYISESIDAIRNIGNFAAHPMKDQASGQIVDVEPGEAEWNLDVLAMLFDFYYVQPTLAKKKRDALNAKLKAAKKPPMK